MKELKTPIEIFFTRYPLFHFSLIFLFSLATYFHCLYIVLWLFFLFLSCRYIKQISIFLVLSFTSFFYLFFFYPLNSNNAPTSYGTCIFSPSSLQFTTIPPKKFTYKGTLLSFQSDTHQNILRKIPAILTLKKNKYVSADYNYKIYAKVIWLRPSFALIKMDHFSTLSPIKKRLSLVEKRFILKKHIKNFLKKHFSSLLSVDLLHALSTGENNNRLLQFLFSRLGLQHILAISGFHFGLILFFLSTLFSKIINNRWLSIILFLFCNIYFLFLGFSPSIFRTWIMVQCFLISKLFNKPYFAINAIGLAALLELILDPYCLFSIGFQLSFLACLAIFLIHPFIRSYLVKYLPVKDTKTAKSWYKKCLFNVLNFLREALCLNLSINLLIIPLLLFHFEKFPVISLIYNLFIPVLIALILFLLLLFFCVVSIPILSTGIKFLLNLFTQFTLQLLQYPPYPFLWVIRSRIFSDAPIVIIYLLTLFICMIIWHEKRKRSLNKDLFCYI